MDNQTLSRIRDLDRGDTQLVPITGGESQLQGAPMGLRRALPKVITIRSMQHGFLVEVGCSSLAISTIEELMRALKTYLKNPAKVEEEFQKTGKIPT